MKVTVDPVVVEDLTNGEREQLRALAEPGGPLWKIIRSMLDYGESLTQSLITANLLDAGELQRAQKVQAAIAACAWVQETIKQALVPVEVKEEKRDV